MSASPYPALYLKKGKERSLANRHPWIFSGAVGRQDGALTEGCIAEVFSHDNRYLATAHFHHGSIVARILSFERCTVDEAFFAGRLSRALRLRETLGLTSQPEAPAYRLVHGEGDGLPGLIVDVYNRTAVIQTHTAGMHLALADIAGAIRETVPVDAVYDKSAALKVPGMTMKDGYLWGGPSDGLVVENGLRFRVDWEAGQKTGFYLDQRDNRSLLERYAAGRRMLNAFAYSGAFSLYGLRAGAAVDSVDSAARAGAWIAANLALNETRGEHRFFASDAGTFLRECPDDYDLMVLDPPAFAKRLSAVNQAVVGYRNLNADGMARLNPGGLLFTFSCSQVIDKELFQKTVFQAAVQARRDVRILHRLTQAPDHPVSIFHPEGEYLKGLVLHVE